LAAKRHKKLQPFARKQQHSTHWHHQLQHRHRRQAFAHGAWQQRSIADHHLQKQHLKRHDHLELCAQEPMQQQPGANQHKQLHKHHRSATTIRMPEPTSANTSSWARANTGSRSSHNRSNNNSNSYIGCSTTSRSPMHMHTGSNGRSPTNTNKCKSAIGSNTTRFLPITTGNNSWPRTSTGGYDNTDSTTTKGSNRLPTNTSTNTKNHYQ
jgi:hypothetical protein